MQKWTFAGIVEQRHTLGCEGLQTNYLVLSFRLLRFRYKTNVHITVSSV